MRIISKINMPAPNKPGRRVIGFVVEMGPEDEELVSPLFFLPNWIGMTVSLAPSKGSPRTSPTRENETSDAG